MPALSFLAALAVVSPQASIQEVPFKLGDNAIIVDARVNGKMLSFMFDTGFGGAVVVDHNISLGPVTGTANLVDFVGSFQAKTVDIKELKLGSLNIESKGMEAIQQPMDGNSFAYNMHTDGIMGLQVIKNRITEINFEKSTFRFHPSSHDISTRTPDNKKTFLLKMLPIGHNSVALPVVTTNGKRLNLALDTGNAFYLTTHRDVLERVGAWNPQQQPKFVKKSMVASGEVDSWSKRMEGTTIFGVPVKSSYWDIIELPSSSAEGDGTVGFGFLKNFNITIDYDRRRVWLENWTGNVGNDPDAEPGLAAVYSRRTDRVVIFDIAPDSPAQKAGLKEGDSILSMDGEELGKISYRRMEAKLKGPAGSKVKLSVSRNGNLMRFEIERAQLVNP